jgi:copper chaperone CopZ
MKEEKKVIREIKKVYGIVEEQEAQIMKIKLYEDNTYYIEGEIIDTPITWDEAEIEMEDRLDDDDDLWKMAVESGNTLSGFEDWKEEVRNEYDPISFLDVQDYNTTYKDEDIYWRWSCIGCVGKCIDPIIRRLNKLEKTVTIRGEKYNRQPKYPKIYKNMVAIQLINKLGESEDVEDRLNEICKEIKEW